MTPTLPAEHIPEVFGYLQRKASTQQLQQVTDYIRETWISGSVNWSPRNWTVYKQSIRTNNDVEGWHNRLNRKARRGQLPFYLLVQLLHEESRMVRIQASLLAEGKLCRYQRRKYRTVQGRIHKKWEEYSAPGSLMSSTSLLRACASVYGPSD